jgi:hypothetical protein
MLLVRLQSWHVHRKWQVYSGTDTERSNSANTCSELTA